MTFGCSHPPVAIFGLVLFLSFHCSTEASELRDVSRYDLSIAKRTLDWLLGERVHYGWGKDTPRALVALELARRKIPDTEDMKAMAKLLKVQTAAELLKNGVINEHLSLTEVAGFVNALLATCQNPRNFHGRDLVSFLRFKADEAVSATQKVSPYVLLSLCLGGLPGHSDLSLVYENVKGRDSDIMALGAMAMTCLFSRNGQHGSYIETAFQFLQKSMYNFTSGDTVDVYTTALIIQAINAMKKVPELSGRFYEDEHLARKTLVEYFQSKNSFDDLLASYYAVPAILGLSLLDLKDFCHTKTSNKSRIISEWYPAPFYYRINYSLWVNKDPRIFTRSRDMFVAANWTFFDVMQEAKLKSEIFNFSYDIEDDGINVYSIAGIPNDPQKSLYWKLYINPLPSAEAFRVHNGKHYERSVDKLPIHKGDRFVFVYAGLDHSTKTN